MPIGDLLAEISGGNPSSEPRPKTPISTAVKRKADDDSHSTTSNKYPKSRQQDGTYSTSKTTRDVKTDPVDRPKPTTASSSVKSSSLPHRTSSPSINGRYQPPVPSVQRTGVSSSNGRPGSGSVSNISQPKKSTDQIASRPKLSASSLAAASKAPPAKSSPTTPTASDPSKAPKKGSYQEIMERAKKAQASMGKVGMIQHKSIGTSKKEQPAKAEQKPNGAKGRDGKPYLGNSRSSTAPPRGGARPGTAVRDAGRNGAGNDAKASGKSRPGSAGGETLEKKIKKSATATTGYTGTARPRPGAASEKPSASRKGSSSAYRTGGLLAPPRPSRRDDYADEYDEDLDDFIEYDEEDTPGYRGERYNGYDSDGSSDMEAGLSDIDVEERRAELLGREEDKREQALEEKLKREKEERKRRLGIAR
ncbi:hypothetical protein F5Y00DRAFT_242775 [Daldinia vernicosa]|uniref:uncharacterized protein n=1 Tax=Daldinia vernicosa TaxID=114800 RepID=UPI002008E52F|nr:uncharacterized protein F5Y00DRAFT_242775 [Daldinia vernicosa]KAI0846895.1 hypothetical protein F5Y00DRAFT_242775 [Daldinia vernicosa]